MKGGEDMGMTDRQFIAYRKEQLENFEEMLKLAEESNADKALIEKLEKNVKKAKTDIEAP